MAENQKTAMGPRLLPADWTTGPREVRKWLGLDKGRMGTSSAVRIYLRCFLAEFRSSEGRQARRHRLLCVCELLLHHRDLLKESKFQRLVDWAIAQFRADGADGAYPAQFRALSFKERYMTKEKVAARRTYIEFFLTGPLCSDMARHIAGLV